MKITVKKVANGMKIETCVELSVKPRMDQKELFDFIPKILKLLQGGEDAK